MIAHSFILFYTMTDNTKEVQHDEKVNQYAVCQEVLKNF